MNVKSAVSALGALAQETRLQIFRLLVRAGSEGLAVGRIAELLATEANGRLSFHLKELVTAGLATASPSGRFIYYSANYRAMNELLAYLTEQCCAGVPCGEQVAGCNPENPLQSPDS
jgi:ArsR family transcriptional regulator, arsenate/arsenite/antimonite-responsive transcriptional repressor